VTRAGKTGQAVLLERVREYEQAHNSHDVEGVMALFTDDIHFETVGEWVMVGKKKVRDLEEWDAALNDHLALESLTVSGGAVTGKATERSDLLSLAGFEEFRYDSVTVEFRGDIINRIAVRASDEDRVGASETFHSMVEWARRERYSDIVKLVQDGKFAYNAENAKGWMTLLQEWLRVKG
jgi:hypothetical protein